MVIIGYELVGYLLFYSFMSCVTFKKSTLMAYAEIKIQQTSQTSFSVKANLDEETSSINL